MIFAGILLLLALVFGPQYWAQYQLKRYAKERTDLPGSGAELARHLLRNAGMDKYSVEAAPAGTGDHFNPFTRVVALSEAHYDKRSLAAAVVAAHEVGHAIQHFIGYQPLRLRTRLAVFASMAERVASFVLVAMPFITVLTRAPQAGAVFLTAGIAIMILPVLVHLITLPVEFDASFNRALPILEQGYLDKRDLPRARRILRACALTYFAASMASVLNFWRWIAILRR